MPWNPAPTAPRCPACNTSVYPAEAVMAADRKPFHKQCVKCTKCKKYLNPSTINEHKNQLFCKTCYDEIFMPQEFCSGTYGGIITPEDIKRKEEEEKRRLEKAERAKRERRCPTCDMKVLYPSLLYIYFMYLSNLSVYPRLILKILSRFQNYSSIKSVSSVLNVEDLQMRILP